MKQDRHELADALAKGYRYEPQNKPPLRPGCTVRLRKGNEHTLVRIESEEDVTAIKEQDNATKEPTGAEARARPDA